MIGDDLRMVHWRTTALTGTLMVRKHVDTNRPQVVILLDDRRASYSEEGWFEEAVEAAASLLEAALRTGAPVRLDYVSGAVSGFVPTGEGVADPSLRRSWSPRGRGRRPGAGGGQSGAGVGRQHRGAGERRDPRRQRQCPRRPERPLPAGLGPCWWARRTSWPGKVGGLEVCQAQGAPGGSGPMAVGDPLMTMTAPPPGAGAAGPR